MDSVLAADGRRPARTDPNRINPLDPHVPKSHVRRVALPEAARHDLYTGLNRLFYLILIAVLGMLGTLTALVVNL